MINLLDGLLNGDHVLDMYLDLILLHLQQTMSFMTHGDVEQYLIQLLYDVLAHDVV